MFVSHMLFDKKRCTEMAKSLKVTRAVTLMAFAIVFDKNYMLGNGSFRRICTHSDLRSRRMRWL